MYMLYATLWRERGRVAGDLCVDLRRWEPLKTKPKERLSGKSAMNVITSYSMEWKKAMYMWTLLYGEMKFCNHG
jgi:hypothetical protein